MLPQLTFVVSRDTEFIVYKPCHADVTDVGPDALLLTVGPNDAGAAFLKRKVHDLLKTVDAVIYLVDYTKIGTLLLNLHAWFFWTAHANANTVWCATAQCCLTVHLHFCTVLGGMVAYTNHHFCTDDHTCMFVV